MHICIIYRWVYKYIYLHILNYKVVESTITTKLKHIRVNRLHKHDKIEFFRNDIEHLILEFSERNYICDTDKKCYDDCDNYNRFHDSDAKIVKVYSSLNIEVISTIY